MKINLLVLLMFGGLTNLYSQQLEIKVTNINDKNARLIVEFYNSKTDFLKQPIIRKVYNVSSSVAIIKINDIPAGKYAIGVIHDENKNGKLDANFLGIPKEPIGLSNYEKVAGPPKYEKALVEIGETGKQRFTIPLN